MKKLVLPLLCAMFFLSGCLPVISVHPFFSEKDVIFDPALIGNWQLVSKNDKMYLSFEKDKENGYVTIFLQETDIKTTLKMSVNVFKLNETNLLDMRVADDQKGTSSDKIMNIASYFHSFPGHTLSKYIIKDNVLTLMFLGEDWFQEKLESKGIKVQYETENDKILLTGQTQDLKNAITGILNDPEAFSVKAEFRKVETK